MMKGVCPRCGGSGKEVALGVKTGKRVQWIRISNEHPLTLYVIDYPNSRYRFPYVDNWNPLSDLEELGYEVALDATPGEAFSV